ncbi:inositol monophosphatase 1-like [Gigantopelta aegis]|uniref:inositol monophosphatase 1-like n=1 Tax=Gigantopelta aegis TaxID=1735272 RepID=UPI001B88A539|nr:inositol monophosphatase 1-like [Gigantopelta aegis]XP_041375506.1 inositol monophosphatase 1-like [Gigantopelta aegis]XP_041375507.1 inositol monophosphatase 1-like [Gigantopelta aegis]
MSVSVSEQQLNEWFDSALCIARKAGVVIRDALHKEKSVETKISHADLVTESDRAVEKMVMDFVSSKYPSHKFIGEESAVDGQPCKYTNDPTWIVDPIDGTTNFVHQIPEVSFSLGIAVNKQIVIGIVYVPEHEKMYTAKRGKGAFCNGEKISVNKEDSLKDAVVICEGGNSRDPSVLKTKMRNMEAIISSSHGIRAYGSAAIDMCKVASGCCEAYSEYGIHCWDIAAGQIIVEEAGGVVMDPAGGNLDLMSRRVLCASTESLAKQLSAILTHLDLQRD